MAHGSLKINANSLKLNWNLKKQIKKRPGNFTFELITRTTTQHLPTELGVEQRALESVYELFSLTREIIKENGRQCFEFTKIAIVVLNQVIRPFTAKWHKLSTEGAFQNQEKCKEFETNFQGSKLAEKIYSNAVW